MGRGGTDEPVPTSGVSSSPLRFRDPISVFVSSYYLRAGDLPNLSRGNRHIVIDRFHAHSVIAV